jgi:tRNA (guanine-N7-)-methyltransferase
MSDIEKIHRRSIHSFVVRSGRMTQGQQRAFDRYWSQYGLDKESGLIDYEHIFGCDGPVVLEIGFGMGGSLVEMAKAAPEQNFIGVEVHRPGIGKLLQTMEEHEVGNIRVFCDDAVEVLKQSIADSSLDRVQIYFPDPWHKKKHHKRRLIQPEFIRSLHQKLKIGAVIHLATDWEHYAEQMMDVLSSAQGFKNQMDEYCFAPRPDYRPVTKFEKRGERLGHGVWDLLFEKTD